MTLDPKLLIVSSDPESLDLLTRRFIRLGYAVTPVSHPRQALEAATFKQFHVAIVQNDLPEVSGMELAQKMRRLIGDVRIILLCSRLTERIDSSARMAGAYDTLPATCPLDRIERTVENAIEDHSFVATRFSGSFTEHDRLNAVTN